MEYKSKQRVRIFAEGCNRKRESTVKNLIKKNQLMITALAIMIAIAGYLQFAGNNLEEEYLTVNDEMTSVVDSDGVITENYTAEGLLEATSTEGMLELSDEDLLAAGLTEIESLDSEITAVAENYLDAGMQVTGADAMASAQLSGDAAASTQLAEATPSAGEIPGEAIFTSTEAVTILSNAKLLKEQTRAKNKETLLEIINSAGLTDGQKQAAVDSMVLMTQYAEKEAAAEILLEAKGFSDVVVSISGNGVDVVVNAIELTDVQRAQIEDIVTRKTDVAAENIIISTVVQ